MVASIQVPIDQVKPSPLNPRKHFDQEKLERLAESLKRPHGMLQPIVVRENKKLGGRYELAAGERRYRAAQIAGLATVPAVVKEISDEELLEIFVIENSHRDDLTPLEEARGYRQLIDSNPTKHSAESIATRVSKSPKYVWDRMKLLDMVPAAQKLLEQGRITVGHAILIARLKPEDQKRVVKEPGRQAWAWADDGRNPLWQADDGDRLFTDEAQREAKKNDPLWGWKARSVRELENWIARNIRFDVQQAAAAAPLLFEGVAAQVKQAEQQPGRGKKVVPITFDHVCPSGAKADERTFGIRAWKHAGDEKGKPCEYSVLGLVVAGPRYSETIQVCVNKDKCKVHWKQHVEAKERREKERAKKTPAAQTKGADPESTSAEHKRLQREEAKRKAQAARDERYDRLIDQARPELLAAVLEDIKGSKSEALFKYLTDPCPAPDVKEAAKVVGGVDTPIKALHGAVLAVVLEQCFGRFTVGDCEPFDKSVSKLLKKLKEEDKEPTKPAADKPAGKAKKKAKASATKGSPKPGKPKAPKGAKATGSTSGGGTSPARPGRSKSSASPMAAGASSSAADSEGPTSRSRACSDERNCGRENQGPARSSSVTPTKSAEPGADGSASSPDAQPSVLPWPLRPWLSLWKQSELPALFYLERISKEGAGTVMGLMGLLEANMKAGKPLCHKLDPVAYISPLFTLILDRIEAPGAERISLDLEQQFERLGRLGRKGYLEEMLALNDRLPEFLGISLAGAGGRS